MNTTRILGFLIIVFCFTAASGVAQSSYFYQEGVNDPLFSLDCASFRGETKDYNRLEVYYRVFNSDLAFIKKGNEFQADYEIVISVNDDDGRPIASKTFSRSMTTDQYSRTMSSRDFRIGQVTFKVPVEDYKIQCILNDKNSEKSIKLEQECDLTKYDNRNPQISQIQFIHAVEPATEDTTFKKGDKAYIPDVRRIYGGDTTAAVQIYFEVYQGSDESEDALIEIDLLDPNDKSVYEDEEMVRFDTSSSIPVYRDIPLKGIPGGDYLVEVVIQGKRGRDYDKVTGPIRIHWSPQAMILNEPDKAVAMLKYIGDKNELDDIKDAETPENRLDIWNEFWKKRDPSPGTPENEAKQDYYGRIEFANQNFSILQREGWRTDRGMIFIQYGPPDQIEDHPFEIHTKAYQVWYYYRSGNQVREFLFVDEFGNNDYVLQYPYDGISY